jgi:hypothetical protein
MRTPLLAVLVLAGATLLILLLKFGTIDPCGILRAQIRQEAARQGGFGVVASALPDSVIDGIIAAQYGPLSPGRCIVLAFEGAPPQAPPAPSSPVQQQASQPTQPPPGGNNNAATIKQAADDARAAMAECKNKRLAGQLKTYVASADCSNPRIIAAFQRAGYRYMDLIYLFTAKRRALAEQVDNGTLTEAQAELETAQFLVRFNDEERQRDRGQR